MDKDKGHDNLISDLQYLLKEAQDKQFHDFENEKYAVPKIELVSTLDKIIAKVKNGHYDN